jgi:hypothetical protein
MNFYRVAHWNEHHDGDDEPRVAAVIAETPEEACPAMKSGTRVEYATRSTSRHRR